MWHYEKDNGILYFISNTFQYKPNIAVFSFSKTLIAGKIPDDIILYNPRVVDTLKQINEHGSLIIIENVLKASPETVKKSLGKFMQLIDNEQNHIPFIFMFSLKNNRYKKPYTHIFVRLQELYQKPIDIAKSIMIGGNAGRLASSIFREDEYDYDRAFAHNIGLTFRTPEQVILGDQTPRNWSWRLSIDEIIKEQRSQIEVPFENIFERKSPYLIFIGGPPASGKTVLANRIKKYLGNVNIFDINNYENIPQMLGVIKETAPEETTIIVDTLKNDQFRGLYLELFPGWSVRYIELSTSRKTCEFLNKFRLQISRSPKLEEYNKLAFNSYFESYRPPDVNKFGDDFKYIKYPLVLRKRDELYFHY